MSVPAQVLIDPNRSLAVKICCVAQRILDERCGRVTLTLRDHMRRREFITLLGGATVWPVVARAQVSAKRPTIAWLSAATAQLSASFLENFLRGMRELGYVEGRNFDMLYRYTDGYQERLPALTEEVIRLKPDVILAPAVISAVAARKVTSTIPIVSPALADAVHLGLIASEARPGGNVTGIEPYVAALPVKQIEFAREIVPGASKIGLLTNLMDPKAPAQAMELEASARTAKINTISVDANHPDDLDGGFRLLSDEKVDVVIVLQTLNVFDIQSEDRRIGIREAASDGLWISRTCHRWRPYQLRGRFALVLLPWRPFCGQNPTRDALLVTCQSSFRRKCFCPSISRRQARWASRCSRSWSPAPTR